MRRITPEILKQIMPYAPRAGRENAAPLITATAYHYKITNAPRLRMWLATLAAESGELKYQEEIASGAAYENRADLGNVVAGDGRRFKGHGRIQITGRDAHTANTDYLR